MRPRLNLSLKSFTKRTIIGCRAGLGADDARWYCNRESFMSKRKIPGQDWTPGDPPVEMYSKTDKVLGWVMAPFILLAVLLIVTVCEYLLGCFFSLLQDRLHGR
jgi:hypothetical protein